MYLNTQNRHILREGKQISGCQGLGRRTGSDYSWAQGLLLG